MEKELKEKVEKSLQKAESKLKAARQLLEGGFYEDSVSSLLFNVPRCLYSAYAERY